MKRAVLLPLLLTGCQQGHVSTLPEAQSYVDNLMAAQLMVVKVEQESLALASGLNFSPVRRPVPSSTPPVTMRGTAVKAPEPVADTSLPQPPGPRLMPGLQHVRYTGTPDTLPALVARPGAQRRLDQALVAIVPAGWNTVLSSRLKAGALSRVSWNSGDQWPFVLEKLAREQQLQINIYWASRQVTVDRADKAGVNGVPATATSPTTTQSKLLTGPVAPTATPPATQAGAAKVFTPVKAPEPVRPAPRVWRADTGSTLKDTLFIWAATTDCEVLPGKKWSIAWVTETNYRIDAPLQFSGPWRDALNQVFALYQNAAVPLYAGTNSAQCVLKVDDKPMN
ncbi:toxin co-regulated pilus biosynthesis Q family protein [Buttiauxella agrestis]|uniref:toxin co-regulated pilus biosynthesis Q family protein n=1 Tax=Buttiauxella agrestis TaxID=82977 RepID=UPI00397526DC